MTKREDVLGVRQAKDILGVSDYSLRMLLKEEERLTYKPHAAIKVKTSGRFGFTHGWRNEGHLRKWHEWHLARKEEEKRQPKPKVEEAPKVKRNKNGTMSGGATGLCSFPGCGKKKRAKGLCSTHWNQQRRGEELRPRGQKRDGTKRKVTKPVEVDVPPFDLKRAVVGVRQAANVLGVTHNVLFSCFKRKLVPDYPHLLPKQTEFRSDGRKANRFKSWYWEDEESCRAWWTEVCAALGRDDAPTPPATIGTSKQEARDEEEMAKFLSEGMRSALRALQDRLNGEQLRAVRRQRGEPARLPLREVLELVLGLGLSHWEEIIDDELDEDEDEDE